MPDWYKGDIKGVVPLKMLGWGIIRANWDFKFSCYDHIKLFEYIIDIMGSTWMWKNGTKDKYRVWILTTMGSQSGNLGLHISLG